MAKFEIVIVGIIDDGKQLSTFMQKALNDNIINKSGENQYIYETRHYYISLHCTQISLRNLDQFGLISKVLKSTKVSIVIPFKLMKHDIEVYLHMYIVKMLYHLCIHALYANEPTQF
eukprot:TRINITY_DN8303_c0_g1_i2.p5 TRINITY_DN8303_c0_g1~~TRINITY_DN8303_c0_g1_i2.p5  ORF type:complete len:117 (+),score=0.99 TRINITY_DN8303_c0_g1_i2:165-515(+)